MIAQLKMRNDEESTRISQSYSEIDSVVLKNESLRHEVRLLEEQLEESRSYT